MNTTLRFLFPFKNTVGRLKLEKKWWHRLAVVLFFMALIPTFLISWALGDEATSPVHTIEQDIHHWGGASDGMLFDLDSWQPIDNTSPPPPPPAVQKTVEMPNGKTATFPATISDAAIKVEWKRQLQIAETKAALFGLGIAFPATLAFSYLLQGVYRALLYVIYGAKADVTVQE